MRPQRGNAGTQGFAPSRYRLGHVDGVAADVDANVDQNHPGVGWGSRIWFAYLLSLGALVRWFRSLGLNSRLVAEMRKVIWISSKQKLSPP